MTRKGEAYALRHEVPDASRLRAAIDRLVAIRDRAADLAAQLIDELDAIDGGDLDAEAAADDDADDADDEPSLGSLDANQQQRWSCGSADDLEGDADEDEEDAGDREPSLGWQTDYTGAGDQTRLAGASEDLEGDPAEAGIADVDALALFEEDRTIRQRFDGTGNDAARDLLDRYGLHRGRWREPIGPLAGLSQHVVEIGGRQVMVFTA